MSRTHHKMVIKEEDIQTRKSWGKVRPFSRIEMDRKKKKEQQECRKFDWRSCND